MGSKSQGVLEVDGDGLIIRRHAYRAVQGASAAAGFEFATPLVKSAVAAPIATQPKPTPRA